MSEPKREARHILDNIDNLGPDVPIRAVLHRGLQIVCTVGQLRAALAARHPGLEEGERVVGPENVEATIQRLAKARCEELHTCLSTSRRDGVVERPCVSCLSITGEKVNAVVGALRTARRGRTGG